MKTIVFIIAAIIYASFQISAQERDWNLVWSDEFDYSGLPDQSKWSFDVDGNSWAWGNNELQNYTPRDYNNPNAWVENGRLIIEARREEYTHSGYTRDYTSARLRTMDKGDWLYGRVEVRAKMPGGIGSWPAIWMLPTDWEYGNWPASGEIDIMEYVGFEPDIIHWTVHTEAYHHSIGTQVGISDTFEDPSENFYTYAIEWFQEKIDFFVDGQLYFTFEKENNATYREWPFDKRFHLLLNIAVGGDWGGVQGIDQNAFPMRMEIEYVRVYEEILEGPFTINAYSSPGGTVSVSPQKNEYEQGETVTITAFADEGFAFRGFSGSISSHSESIEVEVTRNMNIEALFSPAGEMLLNGDFSQNLDYWGSLNTHEGSQATAHVNSNQQLEINITQIANNPWDVQINQQNITLIQGNSYKFSFDASHSNSGSINAGVAMSDDPWTPYCGETFQLTNQMQQFEYEFTMGSETDENVRFFFDVGANTGLITIDNVSLTNLDDENTSINSDASIEVESLEIYPNPFNPIAKINFSIASTKQPAILQIVDINGKLVDSMKITKAGNHTHIFDGSNISSGVYFALLKTASKTLNKKMLLLK